MQHYNTHNYLMYFKRNRISMDSNSQSSMDLCEDHQAPFGGFIWPPRSYSCSFCRREFRSAQALGGHMNVHRRDRARLKQSPGPQLSERSETLLRKEHAPRSLSELRRISPDIKIPREVTDHPTFLDDHAGAQVDSIDHLFVETTECKRRKTTLVAPPSHACSSGKSSSIGDIDLELRLGDPQTVK